MLLDCSACDMERYYGGCPLTIKGKTYILSECADAEEGGRVAPEIFSLIRVDNERVCTLYASDIPELLDSKTYAHPPLGFRNVISDDGEIEYGLRLSVSPIRTIRRGLSSNKLLCSNILCLAPPRARSAAVAAHLLQRSAQAPLVCCVGGSLNIQNLSRVSFQQVIRSIFHPTYYSPEQAVEKLLSGDTTGAALSANVAITHNHEDSSDTLPYAVLYKTSLAGLWSGKSPPGSKWYSDIEFTSDKLRDMLSEEDFHDTRP